MSDSIIIILFSDSWQNSCGYVREIAHEVSKTSKVVVCNPFVQYSLINILFDRQKRMDWLLPFYDKKVIYIPNLAILPFKRFVVIEKLNKLIFYWFYKMILSILKKNAQLSVTWYFTYEAILYSNFLKLTQVAIYDRPDQVASIDPVEDSYLKVMDMNLIAVSSLVIVNSRYSYKYVKSYTEKVVQAPWGLDPNFLQFKKKGDSTSVLSSIPHPRLGMVGAIDHRLDTTLLYNLATKKPGWQIILIGRIFEFSPNQSRLVNFSSKLARILSLPNVHYFSEIPHNQIVKIMCELDVGLVLYDANQEFVKGSNPIKMYEYLACGLPVVSTNILESRSLHPLVITTGTANSFIKAINEQLNNHLMKRLKKQHVMYWDKRNYTWEAHIKAVFSAAMKRE